MATTKTYKTLIELDCQYCGKKFKVAPYRIKEGAKYCSIQCNGKAKRNKIKRVCEQCGNEFEVQPSLLKHGVVKFCSRECFNKSQDKRIERVCQFCGKSFKVSKSSIKRSGAKFCSWGCHNKAMIKKEKRNCKNCNKEFYVIPSQIKKGIGYFCSDKCMRTYQKGENSPHWKGGISNYPYCELFNDEFKERVRDFWNHKCGLCGKLEHNNNKKLAVHHINYDKKACCSKGDPLFIPLCNSCHSKTNYNRKYWEHILTEFIILYFNGESYLPKQ